MEETNKVTTVDMSELKSFTEAPSGSDPAEIVKWLSRLRKSSELARTKFMLALLYVEEVVFPLHRDWGHESFDGFLKDHDLVRPDVYREFVAGLDALGRDYHLTQTLGANVVPLVARVPHARRAEFVSNIMVIVEEKGAEPSSGSARYQAQSCGMPVSNLAARRVTEVERLRAENAELRATNQLLRRELAKLKKASKQPVAG